MEDPRSLTATVVVNATPLESPVASGGAARGSAAHRPALRRRHHRLGARGARSGSMRTTVSTPGVPGAPLPGVVVCASGRGRSAGAGGRVAAVARGRSRANQALAGAMGAWRSLLRDVESFVLPQRCRGCWRGDRRRRRAVRRVPRDDPAFRPGGLSPLPAPAAALRTPARGTRRTGPGPRGSTTSGRRRWCMR